MDARRDDQKPIDLKAKKLKDQYLADREYIQVGPLDLNKFEAYFPEVFATEFCHSNIFSTDHKEILSTKDKANLAMACRQFNSLFKPELKQLAIDKLLTHIIRGEQTEAEKMIKNNPHLLLETSLVEDYSGRKIEGTALQLALGAEDVKYHDDEECMVEMIHKYLKQLPNGENIIAEQTAKQFPEGWEFKEEQRAMRDSDVLNAVINTIANSENPAEWEKAIRTLRNYLEFENKSNVIQTGKHFNHQLLVEALELYSQNYDRFDGFDSAKNNAVWRKVIGTIERYVPAATAQALCTGVGTIVDENGKLRRQLTLHNYHSDRAISYFPLDVDSGSVLGRDFAVYSFYGACCCYVGGYRPGLPFVGVRGFSWACTKIISNKNIKLAALMQRRQPQPERTATGCVIS